MPTGNDSFKVVINHEEQMVVWPLNKRLPAGWKDVGRSGSQADCLKYIKEVWTDRTSAPRKPR